MPGTVLKDIFAEIRTTLLAITGGPFSPDRVLYQGEASDTTKMPAADVSFGEETADLEVTGKIRHLLPFQIDVYFDRAYFEPADTLLVGHTRLYGLIKDKIYADRTINAKVIDARYIGGGTQLTPEDVEGDADRWRFTMRFECLYGHVDTDTDTPA